MTFGTGEREKERPEKAKESQRESSGTKSKGILF